FMLPRLPPSILSPYTTLFRSSLVRFIGPSLAALALSRRAWAPHCPEPTPDPANWQFAFEVAFAREWTQPIRRSRSMTCSRLRRRSEEHTSELQSRGHLVCRLL